MPSINQHPAINPALVPADDLPIANSSFLQNVKYDAKTYQLTVVMKSGATYVHANVSPAIFQQLMISPSKGRFYAEAIKGKSPASRIIDKNVGPQVRNPLKGPVKDNEQRFRKRFAR